MAYNPEVFTNPRMPEESSGPALRAPSLSQQESMLLSAMRGFDVLDANGKLDLNALKYHDTLMIKELQIIMSDANYYVGEDHRYYADGIVGSTMRGGLEKMAAKHDLVELLNKGEKLTGEEVKTLQASLNTLGHDVGSVDGIAGRRTAAGLKGFLEESGVDLESLNEDMRGQLKLAAETPAQKPLSWEPTVENMRLHPDLIEKMAESPRTMEYVEMAFHAADRHGINPYLYANQIWQESRFNPNAVSNMGAIGIAQFKSSTGKAYGLNSTADLKNPAKALDAGARHMADLTREFGDQRLAQAAYNGGSGCIEFAAKKLGIAVEDVTFEKWLSFNEDRHAWKQENGKKITKSAWDYETRLYTKKINPEHWSDDLKIRSEQQLTEGAVPEFARPPVINDFKWDGNTAGPFQRASLDAPVGLENLPGLSARTFPGATSGQLHERAIHVPSLARDSLSGRFDMATAEPKITIDLPGQDTDGLTLRRTLDNGAGGMHFTGGMA